MLNKKVTIGLFSLTGCEGCYFSVIDLKDKFVELQDKLEIKNFRLFEEDVHLPGEKYDVAFIEGSPLTLANINKLKQIRKQAKVLVAFGGCAHIGGIYHMKQYQDKEKIYNNIYNGNKGIDNLEVKAINKIVKVDYTVPGCPINAEEFLMVAYKLIIGKSPEIKQNPVCYECQTRGYECLLQKGELCLGPITLGGCEAICLKSKQGCWGCRGLVEDAEVENLVKQLRKNYSDKEIINFFEVFGVKELINK